MEHTQFWTHLWEGLRSIRPIKQGLSIRPLVQNIGLLGLNIRLLGQSIRLLGLSIRQLGLSIRLLGQSIRLLVQSIILLVQGMRQLIVKEGKQLGKQWWERILC